MESQKEGEAPKNNTETSEATPALEISPEKQEIKPLSDGGAALAAQLTASEAEKPSLPRVMYGGVLLCAAIGACLALAGAYFLPYLAPNQPAAAAEAVQQAYEDPFVSLELTARAVYVYDVRDEKELFSKDAKVQLPLASLTKVMLVLAVADVFSPDAVVAISREAVEKGGGGLTWGEEWRVQDLIDYTLITSSNTGAVALAEAAEATLRAEYPEAPAGNAAVWRMNALAQELGLEATYFINATGLDESTTQAGALGSARDVVFLFKHAIESNRSIFAGSAQSGVSLAPLNYPERMATNTNNALADIPGIIMGKTGTTDLAGGNLAIAFDVAPDHPIIIAVLGSTPDGRFEDMKKLVEAARKAAVTAP